MNKSEAKCFLKNYRTKGQFKGTPPQGPRSYPPKIAMQENAKSSGKKAGVVSEARHCGAVENFGDLSD
jgi:hypothetical protein